MKEFAIRFFSLLSICFMTMTIVVSMMNPKRTYFSWYEINASLDLIKDNHIKGLILAFLFFGLLLFFTRIIKIKITYKQVVLLLVLESLLFFCFIFFLKDYINFQQPVSDTALVFNSLKQFQKMGPFRYLENNDLTDWYMVCYPNNLPLMWLYSGIQKIFGNDYTVVVFAFTVIYLFSVWISFFTLKELGLSANTIFWTIQILFVSFQLVAHIIVAYTDILCLPFVALTFFFFVKALNQNNDCKKWTYIFLSCLAASLGVLSKGTVLILVLALIVILFLKLPSIKKIFCVLPLIVLMLTNGIWNTAVEKAHIYETDNVGIASTHWLVMGLSGTPIPDNLTEEQRAEWVVGGYYDDDFFRDSALLTQDKLTSKQQAKVHFKVIKERLLNMNFKQHCDALINKINIDWGSGDLMTTLQLYRGHPKDDDNNPHLDILRPSKWGNRLYIYMQALQYLTYMMIICASFANLKKKNTLTLLCTIFISGFFLFLMIWETNPRYTMLIFIPAVLMFAESFENRRRG